MDPAEAHDCFLNLVVCDDYALFRQDLEVVFGETFGVLSNYTWLLFYY